MTTSLRKKTRDVKKQLDHLVCGKELQEVADIQLQCDLEKPFINTIIGEEQEHDSSSHLAMSRLLVAEHKQGLHCTSALCFP